LWIQSILTPTPSIGVWLYIITGPIIYNYGDRWGFTMRMFYQRSAIQKVFFAFPQKEIQGKKVQIPGNPLYV